jgi:pimeloyl-ACP methyl ester carboxylesterase
MIQNLERVDVNGIELEYQLAGSGTPVVFIHGSLGADAFLPLMKQPLLRDSHQLIRYHRRGYAGSSSVNGPVSIAEQAADCAGLLRKLEVGPAHMVGHSYGGLIALQLAADHPSAIKSLALMEPAAFLLVPSAQSFLDAMGPVIAAYQSGDKAVAVHSFLESAAGPNARAICEAQIPGSWAQAVADADTFFQVELPAVQGWNITPDQLGQIKAPVLYVQGERTWPIFAEVREFVHRLLPQTLDASIPNAMHLIQIEDPSTVARALATFLANR